MSVMPMDGEQPAVEPHGTTGADRALAPYPGLFPSWRQLADGREPYLVPLVLLLLTRTILGWLLPLAAEDAYITYRYSRNLALGLGPVFNPGERVMGFTSPLWMAWNALGYALTHDPVLWSRASTLLGDAVTLLVAATLLARHASRASAWCFAFVFAAWIAFTGVAISGMENNMMVTLIVLSAGLADVRSRGTGIALGALALIRPEGLAAAALIALWGSWRDRIVALVIAAAGFGVLAATFGSPLPQSLVAKAQVYGTPGPWTGRHWWEWAFPFALGRWPTMPDGRFLFLGTVLAAPAAASGLGVLRNVRRSGLAAATLACLGVWLGYSLVGVAYFYWYLVVPLAGWFLLAAMGLPRIVRGGTIYASMALLVLGCWTVVWELYTGRARAEQGFESVARFLADHSAPGQKVLLEPIGIVGYRTNLVVLDEVGLVSPRIARRRMQGAGWETDVVATEHPDWIVLRRGTLRDQAAFAGAGAPFRNVAERDALLQGYRVATLVGEGDGDAALVVLQRRL